MFKQKAFTFITYHTSLRADTLNLVLTISTLYAIRGPAAPQANIIHTYISVF